MDEIHANRLAFSTGTRSSSSSSPADESANGYTVVARALAQLGIRFMYGVIGIPVTELASAAQVNILHFCIFLCHRPLTPITSKKFALDRMWRCWGEERTLFAMCPLVCCLWVGHTYGYKLP